MKDAKNTKQVSTETQMSMVLFRLDKQTFAVPITNVRQIIEMVTITPVPQVSQSVIGMINFHGSTVPVINLRRHLGMPEVAIRLHTPIVLVMIGGRMLGLLVDDVLDVVAFYPSQMINPNDVLPEEIGGLQLINGLVQVQQGMVVVLDLDHLFKAHHARALFDATDAIQQAMDEDTYEPAPPPVHRVAAQALKAKSALAAQPVAKKVAPPVSQPKQAPKAATPASKPKAAPMKKPALKQEAPASEPQPAPVAQPAPSVEVTPVNVEPAPAPVQESLPVAAPAKAAGKPNKSSKSKKPAGNPAPALAPAAEAPVPAPVVETTEAPAPVAAEQSPA